MNAFQAVLATMGDDPLTEHKRAIAALEERFPLERYAEICAAILHYRPEDQAQVLARMGPDGERWTAVDTGWTDALQCHGFSIDDEVSVRFTRAFMRRRKELRDKNPKVHRLGPLPKAPPPAEEAPPPAAPQPAPPKAQETPTFMKTAEDHLPLPVSELLPGSWGLPELPAMVPRQATEPRQPLSTETAPLDLNELFKSAVPFDPRAPSQLPSRDAEPRKPAARNESTDTMELDVGVLLRPAPGAKGRLIRFDPQTGAPLSAPYWQGLSSTEQKK